MEQNPFQAVSKFLSVLNLNNNSAGVALDAIVGQSGRTHQDVDEQLVEIVFVLKRYRDQLKYQLEVDADYKELQMSVIDSVRPLLQSARYIEWERWRSEVKSQRGYVIALANGLQSPNTIRVNMLGEIELQELFTDVISDLDATMDVIRITDIDKDLRQTLYNVLSIVRRAINNYHITGTEGLIDAIHMSSLFLSGYLSRVESESKTPDESDENVETIKEALNIVSRVATLIRKGGWPKSINESNLLSLPPAIEQFGKYFFGS